GWGYMREVAQKDTKRSKEISDAQRHQNKRQQNDRQRQNGDRRKTVNEDEDREKNHKGDRGREESVDQCHEGKNLKREDDFLHVRNIFQDQARRAADRLRNDSENDQAREQDHRIAIFANHAVSSRPHPAGSKDRAENQRKDSQH